MTLHMVPFLFMCPGSAGGREEKGESRGASSLSLTPIPKKSENISFQQAVLISKSPNPKIYPKKQKSRSRLREPKTVAMYFSQKNNFSL